MKLAAAACLAALLTVAGCSGKQEPPKDAGATPSASATPSTSAAATPSATAGKAATPSAGKATPTRTAVSRPSSTAAASSPSATPATKTTPLPAGAVLVEIADPQNPAITLAGRVVAFPELRDRLIAYQRSIPEGGHASVVLKCHPDVHYEEVAKVMLACGYAKIEDLTLNDFQCRLPRSEGPVVGRRYASERIMIELIVLGNDPTGEKIAIFLNQTQPLGTDFDGLRRQLTETWTLGIAPNTAVLITPMMAARCKYVVRAAWAASDAGFTEVHFAAPYDDSPNAP
jgi:hypothetical protein